MVAGGVGEYNSCDNICTLLLVDDGEHKLLRDVCPAQGLFVPHTGGYAGTPREQCVPTVSVFCFCMISFTGFVIARELRVECNPYGSDPTMPDISSKGPYQKRKFRNLLPIDPPSLVPGEKEARPKMPWRNPPRQHPVPQR